MTPWISLVGGAGDAPADNEILDGGTWSDSWRCRWSGEPYIPVVRRSGGISVDSSAEISHKKTSGQCRGQHLVRLAAQLADQSQSEPHRPCGRRSRECT